MKKVAKLTRSLCLMGLALVAGALAITGTSARADDSSTTSRSVGEGAESKANIGDVLPAGQKNRMPDSEKIDEMVTNNLLRAYSGSKSRWSVASAFSYNGGTILNPLSDDRPNIANTSGTLPKSFVLGQVSTKYNIDVKNSLMAGIGLRWVAPMSSNGQRFDSDNPYVTYQRIYRWLNVQSVLQVQLTQFTNTNLMAEGYQQLLNVDQENMYEIPGTHLTVGASTWVQGASYNKTGSLGNPSDDTYMQDVGDDQADYAGGLSPIVEYALNDKINLRTVVSLFSFEHMRSADGANTYRRDGVYQSVGVGFAVTRDVFLYPNVQYMMANFASDHTNVALNATINVF